MFTPLDATHQQAMLTAAGNGSSSGIVAAILAAGIQIEHNNLAGWQVAGDAPVATQAQSVIDAYAGSPAELQYWQAQKLAALAAVYVGKYAAGFSYTGPDGTKRNFQIDPDSQRNIDVQANKAIGAILNGEAWDSGSYWVAADNTQMPLATAQAMRAFAIAAGQYVATLILTNRAIKDQIIAATTVAGVQAIDVTSGWPGN